MYQYYFILCQNTRFSTAAARKLVVQHNTRAFRKIFCSADSYRDVLIK